MHPICAVDFAWPALRFIPMATKQNKPPLPTQPPPSIKKLHPYPSVSDPYRQIDECLVKDEVHRIDIRSVEIVVAKKVDVVQGVQELIVNHMVILVRRVYEDEGQSETGNQ